MNEVIQAAAELQAVCQAQDWKFCFIGGLALQRWSEPRETVDVDLSVFAGFGDEQQFSDVLLKHFTARISDAATFARERRVLLLRSSKGVGLDVAFAALPYEALIIERSSYFDYP
ncbi:MAG TPA: nucleotidyl transferase AbiEii/AbiGii toxin family protein, partial [Pyrinomonadaceae bacterium]|nr:nucleotidyl transferase AbiEii/AbiGii toxin family protein [Pyrinomonadaceae bacterium]